jgi:hypothetical protein
MTTYQIFFDMFNTIRKNGNERETVALVYGYFDNLIEKSNYDGCSQILSMVELEGMSVKESASFLYITASYKHRIAGWNDFFRQSIKSYN